MLCARISRGKFPLSDNVEKEEKFFASFLLEKAVAGVELRIGAGLGKGETLNISDADCEAMQDSMLGETRTVSPSSKDEVGVGGGIT